MRNMERKIQVQNGKIKVALITNHFAVMGISTVIMNYCKVLDSSVFELTIMAGSPVAEQYKKECEELSIRLVELPSRHEKSIAHYYRLWKTIKKQQYDIVHVHGNSSMMAIELLLAKGAGIKSRIAHSHNSVCQHRIIHKFLNPYFRKLYTIAIACSSLAGNWLFGKGNFEVLPNGLDLKRFIFSGNARKSVRTELEINGKLIIGHIGRFNSQKNQAYLLDIFERVAEKSIEAVLVLIGTGPDFDTIKKSAENHPYKERIFLLGEVDDTSVMYSAMDIFVFPSRYEGLPVVLLEAQISGLPCIVSDRVTKEVDFGNINWQSIEESPIKWADAILSEHILSDSERTEYLEKHQQQAVKYEISKAVKQLESVYRNLTH